MEDLNKRLIAVEERITYAERTISDLSDVLRSLGEKIDAQERLITGLRTATDQLSATIEQPRSLADEKPPHY